MKNIVVLDGYTLNPGDLNWDKLKELGNCQIYDRTPPKMLIERSKDADFLLINKIAMDAEVLTRLPKLKYIGVLATGYNVVDIKAAAKLNIVVTNIPVYGTASVAQMVFAHLLNLTQHVAQHSDSVMSGKWGKSPDFCFCDFPLVELQGLTMGIVGYGRIGRETAKISRAFGMKILAHDKFPGNDNNVDFVELESLFRESDVITLHCPMNVENENMVNADVLRQMKPSAFLINTSRGPLIDEKALSEALNSGGIAGAGLDVLSLEPAADNNPLLKAKNCYITPHISWATYSARKRLLNTAIRNLKAFIEGRAENVLTSC